MIFHLNLSGSKSPQFSWTLLSILADFSSTEVWTISILPTISSSSCLFSSFFGTVLRAPAMISTTVTFIFCNFFSSLARSRYLSSFSPPYTFTLWSCLLTGIGWYVYILKSNISPNLGQKTRLSLLLFSLSLSSLLLPPSVHPTIIIIPLLSRLLFSSSSICPSCHHHHHQ